MRDVSADKLSGAPYAIEFAEVHKKYRLYKNLREQALDVLGIRIPFTKKQKAVEFGALNGVDLKIRRGEQVGIVGRNGAGKTTLLKMLTGNFAPSSGTVVVNGAVQALMQTGLGFHPEFTGEENLKSALSYNGLDGEALQIALDDAVRFVELGQFLTQPFKTYSLGMRSRLQFAAATAIHPDIMIIDEVLGAGDAYFTGKSAARMKKLTATNCTLLLVSHSMQQILQFCERCVWIEAGKIVMDGPALEVVRAYEEFTRRLGTEAESAQQNGRGSILGDDKTRADILQRVSGRTGNIASDDLELDATGISRWPADEDGLRISKIRLLNSAGVRARILRARESASFEMEAVSTKAGVFTVRAVFVLNREDGFTAARLVGDEEKIELAAGQKILIAASIPDFQAGGGLYVASAAIYRELDLNRGTGRTYDLVSRCFEFKVLAQYQDDVSLFYQPHAWKLEVQ